MPSRPWSIHGIDEAVSFERTTTTSALRAFALAMLVASCRPVDDSFALRDSGSPAPVDQSIVDDRVMRMVTVLDAAADERCRCAGDYDTCRLQLQGDWDARGQACMGDAVRLDASGFTDALGCLEQNLPTFVSCHSAYTCPFAAERQACFTAWQDEGSSCLALMAGSAQVALTACKAVTPDAGP